MWRTNFGMSELQLGKKSKLNSNPGLKTVVEWEAFENALAQYLQTSIYSTTLVMNDIKRIIPKGLSCLQAVLGIHYYSCHLLTQRPLQLPMIRPRIRSW